MAISDKTRKMLWGRSGNRCAHCRCELIMAATEIGSDSVIGDECHIIAKSPDGPRGDGSIREDELDGYDNLLLLCKIHHKMIDDQPFTYTVDTLRQLKSAHEKWVRASLQFDEGRRPETSSPHTTKSKQVDIAVRISTGRDVLSVLSHAYGFDFDHDELENKDEVEMVGSFLGNAQDLLDLDSEISSSVRVTLAFNLSQDIKALEDAGFYVFGGVQKRAIKVMDKVEHWPVAVLRVIRINNPGIITIDGEGNVK